MPSISVEKLEAIVTRGLQDDAYAERIFNDREQVAAEYGLSAEEKLVLDNMDRQQFETALRDAEQETRRARTLSDGELAAASGGSLGMFGLTSVTATKMILGRSIICAQGGSYANLTAACDCCAWKGGAVFGQRVINPGF